MRRKACQRRLLTDLAYTIITDLHACAICSVEDGRITALDEYLDPAQVAALQR